MMFGRVRDLTPSPSPKGEGSARGNVGGNRNAHRPGETRGAVMRCWYFVPELICPVRVPRAAWLH